jgi:hypothetical protein
MVQKRPNDASGHTRLFRLVFSEGPQPGGAAKPQASLPTQGARVFARLPCPRERADFAQKKPALSGQFLDTTLVLRCANSRNIEVLDTEPLSLARCCAKNGNEVLEAQLAVFLEELGEHLKVRSESLDQPNGTRTGQRQRCVKAK